MRRIIGIDPGQSGAVAGIVDGELIDALDMPLVSVKWKQTTKDEVSFSLLYDIVLDLRERMGGQIDLAVIERVSSSPQMGSTSSFNFGRWYQVTLDVASAMGIRTQLVVPQKWKAHFKLPREKSLSRAAAIALWPDKSKLFARVKDDGRAEAALLAEYGRCNYV